MNLALEVDPRLYPLALSVTKSMTRPSLGSLNPGNSEFFLHLMQRSAVGNPIPRPHSRKQLLISLGVVLQSWISCPQGHYFYKDIETFIISSSEEKLVDSWLFTLYRCRPPVWPLNCLGPRTVPLHPPILRSTERHFFTCFWRLYNQQTL